MAAMPSSLRPGSGARRRRSVLPRRPATTSVRSRWTASDVEKLRDLLRRDGPDGRPLTSMIAVTGVDDWSYWNLHDGNERWDHIDGTLYMHAAVHYPHDDRQTFLATLLRAYLDETRLGTVHQGPYTMRLGDDFKSEPDVMVLIAAHTARRKKDMIDGPADLVIEIVSPGNVSHDLVTKRKRYPKLGVPESWFIHAERGRVLATYADGGEVEVRKGRLASRTIPGFWIDVAWVLGERTPSVLPALRKILATRKGRRGKG